MTCATPTLSAIRTANAASISALAGTPVAVFVGGTSGIGQGMAENFARLREGRAHIVLVGRNEGAARDIISEFPKPPTGLGGEWSHEFVQCDATLMANVQRASKEILAKHSTINFLVLSPGYMTGSTRQPTTEGIDAKLAVHYYARWKFIHELLPALRAAKDAGEEARVVSVLAAGNGGKVLDDEDFGLEKEGMYTMGNVAKCAPTYNDYMIESFSERNPGITFTHAFPGGVRTNIVANAQTGWIRAFSPLYTALYPVLVSIHDCGEYMWHGLLHGDKDVKEQGDGGKGAVSHYRFGRKGQVLDGVQYSGDREVGEKLWVHTERATSARSA